MKKKVMLILSCLLLSVGFITAQTTRISGVVVDNAGEPVISASVVVKGTTIGTITDLDGKFTINVPNERKTLVFTLVGLRTLEVRVSQNMQVVMETDETLLDEVMVVAYGTAKKSQFTGSASVLKSEEIGKIQTSNVANALVGRVSGVQMTSASGQPGTTTPTIRIRGISSINAGNSPLIILDGTPYDGDLNNLNTQDVESMTVLKDAASNALYGARGANGVIMITTKKGASGSARVTADAKWGANTRATQDYKTITNPAQYYEMYYGALNSYFVNTMGYSAQEAYVQTNKNLYANNNDFGLGYNVYKVPTGQYLIGTNGKLNPNATMGNIVSYKGQDYMLSADNWLDAAYKQSLRQEYNIGISGGDQKSSFYTSFGYLNNEGITAKSDYERLVGRLKADYQVKPWLKVNANMSYTHYESNSLSDDGSSASSGNVFAISTRVAPIYPLYMRDAQGNVMYDLNGIKMYDYGDGENAGLSRPYLGKSNAISNTLLDTDAREGNAFFASGGADITFLNDFRLSSLNSVNIDETRGTSVTNPYYGSYASSKGIVGKSHSRSQAYNLQQLLNYSKSLGLNNISAMLGHEYYRLKYYTLSGDKSNMFDPNNKELNGAVVAGAQSSYTTDYMTEGYFVRGQYDYNNKYFASASFRRDATSRFHPDNRWGSFWSGGVAWIISKENWFGVSWVDMLKLKASYGEQGNDAIGNYRYIDTYDIVNSSGNAAAVPSTMGNKDITWETQGNFNAGVDFELFKGRLTGTAEYFYRKTSDMLFSFPLPPSFGYTSYFANIGDMRNLGVEVELKGLPVRTKDLLWDLHFNFTHVNNKVIYLPEERKTMTTSEGVKGYSGSGQFIGEGISLYNFYNKKYAGVNENGESLFYKDELDAEGNVTGRTTTTAYSDATNYLLGTSLPDVYGGFGTSVNYKGFDLSIDFAFQLGGVVYDSDYASFMGSPGKSNRGSNFHADLLNAWTSENTSSNIPRFQYADEFSNATSDRFLTSASYLSLQNINGGYTLPAKITKRIGVDKLRLYVSCDNVWLWSKRQGLDPRQSVNGSSTSSYYSPIRSISGGLSVVF